MALFKGIGAAMVTPFGKDGKIDYGVLDRYIEHLIAGGVSALLPFGTTGEPATLSPAEYEDGIKFVKSHVAGRVPVIVGAGSNSTAKAVETAETARTLGADGVLVVTPYYNKCTQNGIIEHYKAVCKAAKVPVIAYNVPGRTGVNIAPQTLKTLKTVGVSAIKEASGNIEQLQSTAKVCGEVGIDLYSGDDNLTFVAMMLGALGTISVAANPAPKQMSKLCALCEAGDHVAARALQFELDEFIRALFCEVNPIPAKKAMQLLGFDVGVPRLPLTELEPEHTKHLETVMRELGLIK